MRGSKSGEQQTDSVERLEEAFLRRSLDFVAQFILPLTVQYPRILFVSTLTAMLLTTILCV
jgi:hypothetical protein